MGILGNKDENRYGIDSQDPHGHASHRLSSKVPSGINGGLRVEL